METEKEKAVLTAVDPNLALLASQAALEIDSFIQGEVVDRTASDELSETLLNSTHETGNDQPLLDPPTLHLLSQALGAPETAPGVQASNSISGLLTRARNMATQLHEALDRRDEPRLKEFRAFCIALAEAATAYHHARFESALPSHPNRRLHW